MLFYFHSEIILLEWKFSRLQTEKSWKESKVWEFDLEFGKMIGGYIRDLIMLKIGIWVAKKAKKVSQEEYNKKLRPSLGV